MPTDSESRKLRALGEHTPTARLVASGGRQRGEHRLRASRVVIGADPRCGIVIDDPTVSRRHALIVRDGHRYLLSDLNSTNGTFLNGRRVVGTVSLAHGDRLRFGAADFNFLAPTPVARRGRRSRRAAIGLGIAILALAAVTYYFAGDTGIHSSIPPQSARPSAPTREPAWLARLNRYRSLVNLAPVGKDPALSRADALHARYVVANDSVAIRTGHIGADLHDEDPGKPFFTPEGRRAAHLSDVDVQFSDPPAAPDPGWAIDNWMTGPFHRFWILNPELARVGYGQFCAKGYCAAALNVQSGIVRRDPGATSRPVMYPAARSTLANGTFAADDGEWPSPFAPCPGYSKPTGLPITLQLGRNLPAALQHYSLERDGTPVEACGYDATSYRNPHPLAAQRGRVVLRHFGAIVIVPRDPLIAGDTYLVRATVSGAPYAWSFTVAP